jgi:3-phosphoshikimate 1-carboxyvinyltransferase
MNPEWIDIRPATGPLDARIRPPGSKSLSNRALLLAALADGRSELTGLLDCDDTRLMAAALERLGCRVAADWASGTTLVHGGLAGLQRPAGHARIELQVGNSGTTARFLTAVLSTLGGNFRIAGDPRMHERPISDLVAALQSLGCRLKASAPSGCPPVDIDSPPAAGGQTRVAAISSSQFLSGLLMAAPLARGPVSIEVTGEMVSAPYVEMTLSVMERFGVRPSASGTRRWAFQPAAYQPCDFAIEPDASAASYFFAAAAIAGGRVMIEGIDGNSMQGDFRFVELLERMGCRVERNRGSTIVTGPARRGIDCAMGDISDTAQTLAVVALFCDGTTRIRGIAHNRLKETDRIGNLATELRKAGATVFEQADGLTLQPGPLHAAALATWNDHRMAMSLSLIGLRQPGIRILDPACVTKTYPGYFEDLAQVTS